MPPRSLAIDIVTKAGSTSVAIITALNEAVTGPDAPLSILDANESSSCLGTSLASSVVYKYFIPRSLLNILNYEVSLILTRI